MPSSIPQRDTRTRLRSHCTRRCQRRCTFLAGTASRCCSWMRQGMRSQRCSCCRRSTPRRCTGPVLWQHTDIRHAHASDILSSKQHTAARAGCAHNTLPHCTAVAVVDAASGHVYPGAQSLQTDEPPELYCPGGHGCDVALTVPAMQTYPGGHAPAQLDAVAPVMLPNDPALQAPVHDAVVKPSLLP